MGWSLRRCQFRLCCRKTIWHLRFRQRSKVARVLQALPWATLAGALVPGGRAPGIPIAVQHARQGSHLSTDGPTLDVSNTGTKTIARWSAREVQLQLRLHLSSTRVWSP